MRIPKGAIARDCEEGEEIELSFLHEPTASNFAALSYVLLTGYTCIESFCLEDCGSSEFENFVR